MLRTLLRQIGFDVIRVRPSVDPIPTDCSPLERTILQAIRPYTMTSVDRQLAVIHAVQHILRQNIAGSIVECGVWRGGSSMAAALTLKAAGVTDRDLYLFDTFEGMPPPTDVDRTADGKHASEHLAQDPKKRDSVWAVAGLDDVRRNMGSTGYPVGRPTYIRGKVEETIPSQVPTGPIALLRLDTDWYESTKHELDHLFPRLASGGILIVDDYGHWAGARKAVDEYFAGQNYFLHRIDYTGRLLIKR